MACPTHGPGVGIGDLGEFIYVGTAKGQIYVTQDGGGGGTATIGSISPLGLDGSAVQQIITDPTRGSHDAFAVTNGRCLLYGQLDPLGEQS